MGSEFVKYMDEKIPDLLRELSIPGIAIALLQAGEVGAVRTYGFANQELKTSLKPEHRFRIASISKSVTAWGVMVLVERGLIDLDTPVNEYLTRWKLPDSEFAARGVTARGLLSHTAGLASGGGPGTHPDFKLPSLVEVLSGACSQPLDDYQIAYYREVGLDVKEVCRPLTLTAPAGEKFVYSNSGYALLQLLIEEVSGQFFCDYMRDAVLQPLGMHASGFEDPESLEAFAKPCDEKGKPIPIYNYVVKAAGGMSSTITDLAEFTRASMPGPAGEPPGRGVLSPESVALMHHPILYAETEMGMDFYTGLGHLISEYGGQTNVHHTGGFAGWRSITTFNSATGDGFIALINSSGGNPLWQYLVSEWAGILPNQEGEPDEH